LAYQFAVELGGIKDALINYNKNYNTAERIATSPTAFNSETKAIITALKNRIKKEDQELFQKIE
jgi:hypothetical protein